MSLHYLEHKKEMEDTFWEKRKKKKKRKDEDTKTISKTKRDIFIYQ